MLTKICRDKICYYRNLKIQFGDQSEVKFGSLVELTQVSVRMKVVILIILKLDLVVDVG